MAEKNFLTRSAYRLVNSSPALKYAAVKFKISVTSAIYQARFRNSFKTDPHLIVFESFGGVRYGCNPRALYEELLRDPKWRKYRKIWAFREPEKYAFLAENPNTRVVRWGSREYYTAYAKAAVWVSNLRLPDELKPREDQIYLQTWHGTPLKRLGYDIENFAGSFFGQKELETRYHNDVVRYSYVTSPSDFFREKLSSAFRFAEAGKENCFITCCYPRNDFLFHYTQEDVSEIKGRLGIPEGKRVILYAPTWRESDHDPVNSYQYRTAVDFHRWREVLGEDTVVLFRTHYFIHNVIDLKAFEGFVLDVSAFDDIRELYVISDLLVTDYSSVFFDYANLNRPMIFYMYDYDSYKNELRGFYIDEKELPGPIVKTEEALLPLLAGYDGAGQEEKYRVFNDKYNPIRDGHGSRKVWETVLKEERGD